MQQTMHFSLAYGPDGLTATSAVAYPFNRHARGTPQVFSGSLAKTDKTKKDLEKYALVEIFSRYPIMKYSGRDAITCHLLSVGSFPTSRVPLLISIYKKA
jgi:hypothetical protein